MRPSELFELVPEIDAALLGVPEVGADDNARAVQVTDAIVSAALTDLEVLTRGAVVTAPAPTTPEGEAFRCLLSGAALRFQKRATAMDAAQLHNPDGQGNGVMLDLVRVIGRAERADVQRARKILNRNWVSALAGVGRAGR